jgi:hypothetical protein
LSGTSPLIVIGAGASGLMAALWAAHSGREVIVLEGTVDGGRKILISGGGRCNILPAEVALGRFVTGSSPHALRNILKSWPLAEQVRFFEGGRGRLGQALPGAHAGPRGARRAR